VVADEWPAHVHAAYHIRFGGVDLGNFVFNSRLKQKSYALSGDARVTAMFGAYKWQGTTRSTGALIQAGPLPGAYSFAFQNQSKQGTVDVKFNGDSVSKIDIEPPSNPHPSVVPVMRDHLKGVLDPLSAVMAMSRSQSGRISGVNPCARKLPIFDGKQRFDLLLSFKRTAALSEIGVKNDARAYVCRVKYVPIAGVRMNEETQRLQRETGIEVWMLPMVEANVFVPYHISIPMMAGTATLTVSRLDIDSAKGRIEQTH
jgi:hypothetical protein